MPAKLPGDTDLNNGGNPNAGVFVIFDALSGPKSSPFDARKPVYTTGGAYVNDTGNLSTGGLSTGIGFGCNYVLGVGASLTGAGYNDDYTPGVTKNTQAGLAASADSTIMYIGGGKMVITAGVPVVTPYTTGFGIAGAGYGGSRDSGANTGFGMKMVTATGAVANGAAVETGFTNRSNVALISGQSVFGSATAAFATAA